MIRRVIRIELRHRIAVLGGLGIAGMLTWSLLVSARFWAGNWLHLATGLRRASVFPEALLALLGAWTGSRERRRATREQLIGTARPYWQPYLASWAVLTLAAVLGLVLAWLIGAALVAPVATYSSGGWWWLLLVTVPAFGAASAFGMALGQVPGWPVITPVVLGVGLLGVIYVSDAATRPVQWLLPNFQFALSEYTYSGFAHLTQAAWFLAVAVTLLVVVGFRRRWFALLPGALAVAAASVILSSPVNRLAVADPASSGEVCTTHGPQVCVVRAREYLLPETARLYQPILAKVQGIPGAAQRAVSQRASHPRDPPTPADALSTAYAEPEPTITGEIDSPVSARLSLIATITSQTMLYCFDESTGQPSPDYGASSILEELLRGNPPIELVGPTGASGVYPPDRVLHSLLDQGPRAQRQWLTRYFAAVQRCDGASLRKLAGG